MADSSFNPNPSIVLRDDAIGGSDNDPYPQLPVSDSVQSPYCASGTGLPAMTQSPGTGGQQSEPSIPAAGMVLTPASDVLPTPRSTDSSMPGSYPGGEATDVTLT
jgi:hypothetical protein